MIKTTTTSLKVVKKMNKRNALLLAGVSAIASLGIVERATAASQPRFAKFSALAVAAGTPANINVITETGSALEGVQPVAPEVQINLTAAKPVPILSSGLIGTEQTVRRGTVARFLGFSNYPAFINRAELRIFNPGTPANGIPHAIVETGKDGITNWTPSTYASDVMSYVYRVYDAQGNFDETEPKPLTVLSAAHVMPVEAVSRPEFGLHDSAAVRGIPFHTAKTINVEGNAAAPNELVRVSGQIVPTDHAGRFIAEYLVPEKCQGVTVSSLSICGNLSETQVSRDAWTAPVNHAAVTEGAVPITGVAAPIVSDGLSITIDPADQPKSDNPYRIRVRNDENHADPVLAVGLAESERTVVRGQAATFISYTNYPALIARREVRIFRADASTDSAPLAVVDADNDGVARWNVESKIPADLFYVYRVYDREGRFDETKAQELTVVNEPFDHPTPPKRPLFGTRDEAGLRNISFSKTATVTVTGTAAPTDVFVRVADQLVPLQSDGTFVSQQIISNDTRQVRVVVSDNKGNNFTAVRDVEKRHSNWFVVGQGDLTFIANRGSAPAVEVSGDKLANGDNFTSRAAFYAKGKVGKDWKVTASLDTGETLLGDIFSNIDRKDPRQLLRRMDSNQYYTTYGDDSTLVEDAPTQGRFYLKVQKDQTSLLVGNFTADIQQAELAQLNRGLFGGIVDHKSMGKTSFGESKLQFTAFGSDPGSLPGRDEFRGTGGSLYYLKRRDLTVGSERLSIETRDRDTGLVLARRDLRPQEDYDIDYFQGRVTLLRPLSSTASDGSLVRDGSSGGDIPVLVANYEFTPAVGDLTGYTLGGRAAAWLGDTVRLGVTAQRETTGAADQLLVGADATVRLHAGTFLKAEVAQTDGPGFGQANSVDGGLSFVDRAAPGTRGIKARAYRTELSADFAEMRRKQSDLGKLSGFYEHFDAGFSANGQLSGSATERWGAKIAAPLGDTTSVSAKIEHLKAETVGSRTIASGELAQKLGGGVTLTGGLRHDNQAIGLLNNSTETGKRTDAALQLGYAPAKGNWSIHGFGQVTINRDLTRQANNRVGLGGRFEISDRQSLSGEVSYGDGGVGANVELTHRYGRGSETYLGYALITDRTDLGLEPATSFTRSNRGTLTMGARHRFSSALSIHGENKIGHGGDAPSVMRSFGFDFDPSEHWSFTGSFENGLVDDAQTGRFKRTAATIGAAYTSKTVQFGANVEGRFERGNNQNQNVWLFRNHASVQLNPDWRALGQLNFAIADNETNDVRAADFIEGTVGFAYRPILNDRLNLLARYTYLKDMGPIGQITQGGETAAPKQKSQIFAIDANFDLTKTLTIGGKYAYRQGSVSLGRNSDTFVSGNTQLLVLRADWRLVKNWDAMIEGHRLTNDLAGDGRWGGVAALYRHINKNVKIGAGYSFSDFSSDLRDQSYSSKGFFINLLAKF